MRLLYFLADAFIHAFGITKPTETTRRNTAFFIAGLIGLAMAGMLATALVVHQVMN